jgi:hypothetical protein
MPKVTQQKQQKQQKPTEKSSTKKQKKRQLEPEPETEEPSTKKQKKRQLEPEPETEEPSTKLALMPDDEFVKKYKVSKTQQEVCQAIVDILPTEGDDKIQCVNCGATVKTHHCTKWYRVCPEHSCCNTCVGIRAWSNPVRTPCFKIGCSHQTLCPPVEFTMLNGIFARASQARDKWADAITIEKTPTKPKARQDTDGGTNQAIEPAPKPAKEQEPPPDYDEVMRTALEEPHKLRLKDVKALNDPEIKRLYDDEKKKQKDEKQANQEKLATYQEVKGKADKYETLLVKLERRGENFKRVKDKYEKLKKVNEQSSIVVDKLRDWVAENVSNKKYEAFMKFVDELMEPEEAEEAEGEEAEEAEAEEGEGEEAEGEDGEGEEGEEGEGEDAEEGECEEEEAEGEDGEGEEGEEGEGEDAEEGDGSDE